MTWQVVTKRSFDKDFADLPAALQRRVGAVLLSLQDSPFPAGCKKLRGSGDYPLRVGDYRVVYEVDGALRKISLSAVGHRREVYRRR